MKSCTKKMRWWRRRQEREIENLKKKMAKVLKMNQETGKEEQVLQTVL